MKGQSDNLCCHRHRSKQHVSENGKASKYIVILFQGSSTAACQQTKVLSAVRQSKYKKKLYIYKL